VPNNVIREWRPGAGTSDFLRPSGYFGTTPFPGREPGSNGLAFDQHGRLVFAQHGERSISRRELDGSITKLVERYQGKRLNSPNDIVFASNGDLYFTDPPFGLPKSFDDPGKELPFQGVYRLSKSGQFALLTAEVGAPNGIAFSPDEKTLYISDSRTARWLAFPVEPDGTLSAPRVLFDAAEFSRGKPGVADGMKVDNHGNIFGAGPGGLYVIAPDGALLGWINFGVATGNCAWGEDGSTLFITSNTAVYRVRLNTKGAHYAQPIPDPVAVYPENYRVLLENSSVRVLDFVLRKGSREDLHSHPKAIQYVLSAYRIRFAYPDGTSEVREAKAGDVYSGEALTHASENIGDSDAHGLLIEFKTEAPSAAEFLTAVTFIRGKPGTEDEMKNELFSIEAPTRAEPGNVAYDLYQSPENANEFMRFEIWRTPEDLELHKQTPHLKASFERRKEQGWTTQITRWKRIRQEQ
jgi:gluconolactonase